jgi:hypothetical protein
MTALTREGKKHQAAAKTGPAKAVMDDVGDTRYVRFP